MYSQIKKKIKKNSQTFECFFSQDFMVWFCNHDVKANHFIETIKHNR